MNQMVEIKGKSYEIATINVLMKHELRRRGIWFRPDESTQDLMDKLLKKEEG